jgi:hypothetical protein
MLMRKFTVILVAVLAVSVAASAQAKTKAKAPAKPAVMSESEGKKRAALGIIGLLVPGASLVLLHSEGSPYR